MMAGGRTAPVASASTVLFVDNDFDTLDALAFLARDLDYRVCTADSAEDALAVLRIIHIDVIVAEPRVPSHDGCELLERLHGDRYGKHIPTIALTSEFREEARAKFIVQGCREVLFKPCQADALLRAIARALIRRSEGAAH